MLGKVQIIVVASVTVLLLFAVTQVAIYSVFDQKRKLDVLYAGLFVVSLSEVTLFLVDLRGCALAADVESCYHRHLSVSLAFPDPRPSQGCQSVSPL